MGWRNDQAATLYFVQALDEGNPETKVDYRDEILYGRLFNEDSLLKQTAFYRYHVGNLLRSPWTNGTPVTPKRIYLTRLT
jgi:hypothetical protein